MTEKRTKIVCTISDGKCSQTFIRDLFRNGMDVVRINTAHSTIESAARIVKTVREVSDRIGIMIDTKGPEIRLTRTEDPEGIALRAGDIIRIEDGTDKVSSRMCLYTSYPSFAEDIPTDTVILIDDGNLQLKVISKDSTGLDCLSLNDGTIKSRKSINVPDVRISLPAVSGRDMEFIRWAAEEQIDFIAHSFVRSREDLIEVRRILEESCSHIKIIAKIENQQGIDNLDEILAESFGVMIARGDLGVEIPAERLPLIQKQIISRCRVMRKPVIVATQMLHSMIENPRPTRAEVTDIANAVFQRADAIMLSGETASGRYPVEAVKVMSRVAAEAEKSADASAGTELRNPLKPIAATLARNLVESARHLPVKAIILDTWTGRTGRYIAAFRPDIPVYALCYRDFIFREMSLIYGITAFRFEVQKTKDEMVRNAIRLLLAEGKIAEGDLIGFIGGSFNDGLGATYLEFKYVRETESSLKGT